MLFVTMLRRNFGLEDELSSTESDLHQLVFADSDHATHFTHRFCSIASNLKGAWSDRALRNAYAGKIPMRILNQFVSSGTELAIGLEGLVAQAERFDRAYWTSVQTQRACHLQDRSHAIADQQCSTETHSSQIAIAMHSQPTPQPTLIPLHTTPSNQLREDCRPSAMPSRGEVTYTATPIAVASSRVKVPNSAEVEIRLADFADAKMVSQHLPQDPVCCASSSFVSFSLSRQLVLSISVPTLSPLPLKVLIDSRCTRSFIDQSLLTNSSCKAFPIDPPITLRLFDGTVAQSGAISSYTDLDFQIISLAPDRFRFLATCLDPSVWIALGYDWLLTRNPNIDWITGRVIPRNPAATQPPIQRRKLFPFSLCQSQAPDKASHSLWSDSRCNGDHPEDKPTGVTTSGESPTPSDKQNSPIGSQPPLTSWPSQHNPQTPVKLRAAYYGLLAELADVIADTISDWSLNL